MSEQTVIKTQNYCLAVREQLGYPPLAPVNHTLAFASGGPATDHKLVDLARHATAMQRDIVYAAWTEFSRPEPAEMVLALRELSHVDVITGCYLWAADAKTPLVIIAPGRGEHFVLGQRGYLDRRPGFPAKQLGRGRAAAGQPAGRARRGLGPPSAPTWGVPGAGRLTRAAGH